MLATHVYWNDYDYAKSISFIRNHIGRETLNGIYKDQNLISNDYRKWLIANAWRDYLIHLDFKKDSSLRNISHYKMLKVEETYKGAVRDFAWSHLMEYDLELMATFEQINHYKATFESYLSKLKNKHPAIALQTKYDNKYAELIKVQAGKPAPPFSLQNDQGETLSLDDFKNKVVYIDLWASWCVPCREETASFKILHNKYKNDPGIVFVSIAVQDEIGKWRKALNEDKPTWIQLFDQDGRVAKAYAANEIPRFVLIDKQGKIVDFDAPRPSSGKLLEELIERELRR